MRILVVDDVAAMRQTISKIITTGSGHEVREACCGTEAMGMLDGIDLILTDLAMPGMHGLSLIRAVREKEEYSDIPIIVVSVTNTSVELARVFKAGAVDYIVKPFKAQTLLCKIESVAEGLDTKAECHG